jgi:hypothetical protein
MGNTTSFSLGGTEAADAICSEENTIDLAKLYAIAKQYPKELPQFQNVVQTIERFIPQAIDMTFETFQTELLEPGLGLNDICFSGRKFLENAKMELVSKLCLGIRSNEERETISNAVLTNMGVLERGQISHLQQDIMRHIDSAPRADMTLRDFADEIHAMRTDACTFLEEKSKPSLPCNQEINDKVEALRRRFQDKTSNLTPTETYILYLADRWLSKNAADGRGGNQVCKDISEAQSCEDKLTQCQKKSSSPKFDTIAALREAKIRREALKEGVTRGYQQEYQRGFEAGRAASSSLSPPPLPPPVTTAPPQTTSLNPADWVPVQDSTTGKTYFWNRATAETRW